MRIDDAALKECLGSLTNKVFYCGSDSPKHPSVIYAKDEQTCAEIFKVFAQKAIDNPDYALIKIKPTSSLKLEKTRSLEDMLTRIPHQHIAFDPTATIERASILVAIAKQVRQE